MAIPFRLLFGVVFASLVYWTHHVREPGIDSFPIYYYVIILSAYALHQVCISSYFMLAYSLLYPLVTSFEFDLFKTFLILVYACRITCRTFFHYYMKHIMSCYFLKYNLYWRCDFDPL